MFSYNVSETVYSIIDSQLYCKGQLVTKPSSWIRFKVSTSLAWNSIPVHTVLLQMLKISVWFNRSLQNFLLFFSDSITRF